MSGWCKNPWKLGTVLAAVATGPHKHSMLLVGGHKVLVATVAVVVPYSSCQADCGNVTMALMALIADTLSRCVT